MLKKFITVGLVAPFFLACSAEDPQMEEVSSGTPEMSLNISADLVSSDLIGTWEIISMTSDVAVDLNDVDSVKSKDLLKESDCFSNMFFTFDPSGIVVTGQAKLDFSDGFDCSYGEYEATYVAQGDELEVSFLLNGITMTQKKKVGLSQDENGEYLHVFLTETEAALYVNDPETTVASEVGRVDLIFRKRK